MCSSGLRGRTLGRDRPVVGNDADLVSVQHGTTADRLLVIFGLEVEKFRTVDQTRDHLTAIERLAVVGRPPAAQFFDEIGRAAYRESVCQYVSISVVDVILKKQKKIEKI